MATKKNSNGLVERGWHFLPSSMKLDYGDGRKAEVGKTLSIPKSATPHTCSSGMHASLKPSQAASFCKGPVLTRVEVWGDIETDNDKFCGRNRRVLWAKELKQSDVLDLTKAVGKPAPPSKEVVERSLANIAGWEAAKFDAWIDVFVRTNGMTDALLDSVSMAIEAIQRPTFDAKSLLAQLMPRTIRTKKEILRDVKGFYDLTPADDWNADRFDEVVEELDGDRIIVIEDFSPSGEAGYVLKPRAR